MMKAYLNCFTGAITHSLGHSFVKESDIVLFGDGYLLRSGIDEYGVPELTFKVLECGELALKKFGVGYSYYQFGVQIDFDALRKLCKLHNNGIIAWANSSHLSYSSLYSTNMGYLHSIVLEEVNDTELRVFDPLVVDIPPYAMYGNLSHDEVIVALTDADKIDSYDVMGAFFKIHPIADIVIDTTSRKKHMGSLAERFFSEPVYNKAIMNYISSNQLAYEDAGDERKKHLSRRIFDHIRVLYVLPLLELLKKESHSVDLRNQIDEEIKEWRSISMMALKNSKVLSERVFNKIITKMLACSQMRDRYWKYVREER